MRTDSRLAVSLALGLVLSSALTATDTSVPLDPWAGYLRILEASGVTKTEPAALANWLRSAPPEAERWAAIEVAGLRGDRVAIPTLRLLLARADEQRIREAAALALARLGEPDGHLALVRFTEASADWQRQLFLATRLAKLGDAVGYRFVAQAAHDSSASRRRASAAALVAFLPLEVAGATQVNAQELLLALARDEDNQVRIEFAIQWHLAIAGGANGGHFKAALDALATTDPDQRVRQKAGQILAELAPEGEERSQQ